MNVRKTSPKTSSRSKSKALGLRQTICRLCSGRYSAKHYRDNADLSEKRGTINSVLRPVCECRRRRTVKQFGWSIASLAAEKL